MSSIYPAHLRLSGGGVIDMYASQTKSNLNVYVTEWIYIHYFSLTSVQPSMIAYFLLYILCIFTPRSWTKVILLAAELLCWRHCSKASWQLEEKRHQYGWIFSFCFAEQSFTKVPLWVGSLKQKSQYQRRWENSFFFLLSPASSEIS